MLASNENMKPKNLLGWSLDSLCHNHPFVYLHATFRIGEVFVSSLARIFSAYTMTNPIPYIVNESCSRWRRFATNEWRPVLLDSWNSITTAVILYFPLTLSSPLQFESRGETTRCDRYWWSPTLFKYILPHEVRWAVTCGFAVTSFKPNLSWKVTP